MSEHQQRIQTLMNTVPKVERSFWQRTWRAASNVAVVVSFVALALAGFAGLRAVAIAGCTNQNLGARNAPNVADREAMDAMFEAQKADMQVIVNPAESRADKIAALADFVNTYTVYQTVRATDDQLRKLHPIGQC